MSQAVERDTTEVVRDFLVAELGIDAGLVDECDDLIAIGAIDSIQQVQLVVFLEERFGLVFAGDELQSEKLTSVQRITSLVLRKQETPAAPGART